MEVVECAEQDILKAIRDANAVYSGRFPMVLQSDGVNVTCPNTAARLVGASLIPKVRLDMRKKGGAQGRCFEPCPPQLC